MRNRIPRGFSPVGTRFNRRIVMIVDASDRNKANGQMKRIDPSTGGDKTFGVPLSATGNDPATHYVSNMAVTGEMLDEIIDVRDLLLPTATIHRGQHDYDHEPIVRYTFEEVLTQRGLQKIKDIWQ